MGLLLEASSRFNEFAEAIDRSRALPGLYIPGLRGVMISIHAEDRDLAVIRR
jgi:hypothetical protein